jgi:hypothetical protein
MGLDINKTAPITNSTGHKAMNQGTSLSSLQIPAAKPPIIT